MSDPASLTHTSIDSETLAQFCKASADELRVKVLRILHHDSFSVQELCAIFDLKQSAMSHHLKVLAGAQLVTTRREGNTIYYRRRVFPHDHTLASLQSALFGSIDQCLPDEQMIRGLADVERHREHSSRAFFVDNADRFREQQDLIARFEQYADSVEALLKAIPLSGTQHAIEIGPGEGLFLPALARLFSHVTALDTSMAMVHKAGQLVRQHQLTNVTLVNGDARQAAMQSLAADCVVINMVLHHVATPVELFQDVSRLLNPGGAVIVTDLCHHDQSWARDACGDVWLGFEPDDLGTWAAHAGLAEGQSSYLAQRNGFRIQIRHFNKKTDEQIHNTLLPS